MRKPGVARNPGRPENLHQFENLIAPGFRPDRQDRTAQLEISLYHAKAADPAAAHRERMQDRVLGPEADGHVATAQDLRKHIRVMRRQRDGHRPAGGPRRCLDLGGSKTGALPDVRQAAAAGRDWRAPPP